MIGPDGAWSVLDGWRRATYGYLDVSDSRVIPTTLEISPGELIEGSEMDSSGRVTRYTMSRRKIGDRADIPLRYLAVSLDRDLVWS